MSELLGAFETTRSNLANVLKWSSAPFDERYDEVYLNLSEDELRTVGNAGEAITAFCTFKKPYVQDVELGDGVDAEAGMESIIRVPDVQDYLNFVGGDRIRVEFYSDSDSRGADKMVVDGDITAELFVPSSEANYESKQLGIVGLYDSEDRWIAPSTFEENPDNGEPLSTTFRTKVQEFEKIIEAKEFDDFVLSNYPVVVQNGEFRIEAFDDNDRNSISGSLYAEDVNGPDVNNTYSRGFAELFDNIDGKIRIGIENAKPISVVRESNDEALTLRYCILPTK